jgi:CheY-like chemotaxis protein
LQILSNGEHIDVLFTDIMMPGGMLGPKLAERARQLQPNIHVLFTTGYANTQAMHTSQSVVRAEVIPKPFRTEELALRIRQLLDQEAHVG